jgi:hypothetical protein
MKRIVLTTVSLALAAPAVAQDHTQLAVSAGISRGEAQTLTLTEIAAYAFNRGTRGDDRQAIIAESAPVQVDPARHAQLIAAAGLTPAEAQGLTLSQLAAAKHNAGTRGDDRQTVMAAAGAGMAGPQLVAAAGLDAGAAEGLSLSEVAAVKFNRDTRQDDRQTTAR